MNRAPFGRATRSPPDDMYLPVKWCASPWPCMPAVGAHASAVALTHAGLTLPAILAYPLAAACRLQLRHDRWCVATGRARAAPVLFCRSKHARSAAEPTAAMPPQADRVHGDIAAV